MANPDSAIGWQIRKDRGLLTPEQLANPPEKIRASIQGVSPAEAPAQLAVHQNTGAREIDASRTGSSYTDNMDTSRPLLDCEFHVEFILQQFSFSFSSYEY